MELFITDLSLIKRALEDSAIFYGDIAQVNDSEYFKKQSQEMIELKAKLDELSADSKPFYTLEVLKGA